MPNGHREEGPSPAANRRRRCRRCHRTLPISAFGRRGRDGLQEWCRECKKAYDAAWYQANKERRKQKVVADRLAYLDWLDSLKDGKACADCGRSYPRYVMEWDHLPGRPKTLALGNARNSAYGKERILAELANCELVCANCHRERTFQRARRDAA